MKKKILSILGLTSVLTSVVVCSKTNAYAFDIMEDPDIIANVYVYAFNDGKFISVSYSKASFSSF